MKNNKSWHHTGTISNIGIYINDKREGFWQEQFILTMTIFTYVFTKMAMCALNLIG